ncbi:hypothetical protein MTO96_023455 [Rhipicephalus appendiculatus]
MDQGRLVLQKRQLVEDGNEKRNECYLVLWLAVGVGLFCCLLVLGLMSSNRSEDDTTTAQESVYLYTQLRLAVPYIPETNQLPWQKAAGMYHACLNFIASYEPETPYLVQWLVSLDLDLLNETRLANVNPVKMMVRGSLDLGVPAVIAIFFNAKYFAHNKRVIQAIGVPIFRTTPTVPIRPSDSIYYREHALQVLVKLFESMGEAGLRYLVAWKFYSHLVPFTEPYMFLRGLSPSDACYDHVRKVMNLAILSPFLQSEVPERMVQEAKNMVQELRNSFLKALRSSTWLSHDFRQAAVKKMMNMVSYVGSPGGRLEPEYVEALYKPYPDAPLDLLFPTWIKALGLSSHYMWTDTTTPLYDETRYSPFYMENHNDFTIPTISMFRPFMYPHAITALNYGGLGQMIGHEIMHAFDVRGIHFLEGYVPDDMDDVIKEYTKRALCLRKSHKSVLSLSGQEGTLNDDLDSENLADLAGTKVAYDAFASLDSGPRDQTIVGLEMSAKQLFFFNHCAKWCTEDDHEDPRYAPKRSRCIVPLMNMPDFSRAFGCAAGTAMNPRDKCTFW